MATIHNIEIPFLYIDNDQSDEYKEAVDRIGEEFEALAEVLEYFDNSELTVDCNLAGYAKLGDHAVYPITSGFLLETTFGSFVCTNVEHIFIILSCKAAHTKLYK